MNEQEYQEKYGEKSGEFREKLSDLCHEQWVGWMKYLFQHGTLNDDSTFTIDADSARRWARQVCTKYAKLSEREKQSDRNEADRFIELICEYNRVEQ